LFSSTMLGIYTSVFLFSLTLLENVLASPCVTFDIYDNLLAFGLGEKDWSAGTQDNWASNAGANDITTGGRPPFDGTGTTCYLSQFFNAIYVINGDKSNPTHIHIYDIAGKSWSTQITSPGSLDYSSIDAILDHDTNVFYALSHGEMYSLDFGAIKQSSITSEIGWTDVQKAPFADGYKPVMALAQNHIHFLNVPGNSLGQASIFVIHFSWFQPDPESYPAPDNQNFPSTYGQVASFFQPTGVQQEFAFIPDDFSGTYIVNVETNTTRVLADPAIKDNAATYFAGINSLVQLDSTGAVSFIPHTQSDVNVNFKSAWASVKPIAISYPSGASRLSPSLTSSSPGQPSFTSNSSSGVIGGQASGANQGIRIASSLVAVFCIIATASLL